MAALPSGARTPELREALLAQLAYLLDEIEALRPAIRRVPEPVLSGRPLPNDLSIKEMYGLLVEADTSAFLPFLEKVAAGEAPTMPTLDAATLTARGAWNEQSMTAILDALHAARAQLLDFLLALPPEAWLQTGTCDGATCDVYGAVYHVTQHDTEWLRAAAYRLHESRLSDRPGDIPR